jgi:hypothetical protein
VLFTLAVVGVALGVFRILAPSGWRTWQQVDGRSSKRPGSDAAPTASVSSSPLPEREVA